MTSINNSLSPEKFWKLYSEKLNELKEKNEARSAYGQDKSWTPVVLGVVKKVLKEDLGLDTGKEYMRVDVIGYKEKEPFDWDLKVAYEHENQNNWDDELCKLCHVVADLRVISSYIYDKEESIECVLKEKIDRLGIWRMFRVPNSSWLFVFGPLSNSMKDPFRAFTINSDFQVIEITTDEKVIPDNWK